MNRLDERLQMLASRGSKAFIPYLSSGDPDLATTARLLRVCQDNGADAIELGIPFSDPIADGPVIQASFTRALAKGLKVRDVMAMVSKARDEGVDVPIIAMLSYSLVYRMGADAFVARAADAGLDGATIPDLPVDEGDAVEAAAAKRDFRLIHLIAPTTDAQRRERIIRHAQGFIYYISVRGITGVRASLPVDLAKNIACIRAGTTTPVAVGFGIGTPEQAAEAARHADGVIVGSAIVKLVNEKTPEGADAVDEAVGTLVRELADAAKSVTAG